MKINAHFRELNECYLFTEIGKIVEEYQKIARERVIKLSIGDVTLPLPSAAVQAMKRAAEEMGEKSTFRGYGPESSCYGYPALIEAIQNRYQKRGVHLRGEEIFISDGAKSDLGNLLDLFSRENTVLIPDPVYPAYLDANRMAGRTIVFLGANEENGFLPLPDKAAKGDILYLCSPNNPTGVVYSKDQLKKWVDYALEQDAVIFFDAAYEAFIGDPSLPHSIYEIEGAKFCAIEICSFSKTAGFTGVRCGYTIVPKELKREGVFLNPMFFRRQTAKFNGVSYISQMGAAAVFSPEGERQTAENLAYYKKNAEILSDCLKRLGFSFTGGIHSPYLWVKSPGGMSGREFFEFLLRHANLVGTPGDGFGKNGEGYLRITAFGSYEDTCTACRRLQRVFAK